MKAISLFSGGLDSQLAVALIKNQGITVVGMNFSTPFFGGNQRMVEAADSLGIELHTVDISDDYIPKVLLKPVYGYGKNFNPCIDCHAYMLKKAGEYLQDLDASFIITGEVLGQRPMSQNRSALNAVDKLSGLRGLILRPLSARLLPLTVPEQEGWVNREELLDISGRGRNRQIELAEKFGIIDYPSPAGGCLLTEQNFARRLRKTIEFIPEPLPEDLEILKLGRHFYLGTGILLVVGRNHSENERIMSLATNNDYLLKVTDYPGPLGLLRKLSNTEPDFEYSAAIVARYSDAKNLPLAEVRIFNLTVNTLKLVDVPPLHPEQIPPAT